MVIPFLYKLAAVALVASAVVTGAYLKGRIDANANCREKELLVKIAGLERDIAVQNEADAFEAAALIEAEAENKRLTEDIESYAEALKTRPAGGCSLGADDIDRLRRIRGGH